MAERFAAVSVNTTFDQLPSAAIDAAARGIVDTVGVALAATGLAAAEIAPLVEMAMADEGAEQSTVLGYGFKAPATTASWVLGGLSHLLDFDDFVDVALVHPSAAVVAAALPLAEMLPGVSGRRLISSVAVGQDLAIRLNLAIGRQPQTYGWLPSLNTVFGATLCASSLLELSQRQTANALGLALHRSAGSAQCAVGEGSSFRGLRDAFSAQDGVTCALLARRGVRGDPEAFEGRFGLFANYFHSEYNPGPLWNGLGREFRGELAGQKQWPSCAFSHLFIASLLDLMRANNVAASDVARIVAFSDDHQLEGQCTPRNARTRPAHAIDAKVSLPFVLGKALVHGNVTLLDFTDRGLRDQAAQAAADRVDWRHEVMPTTRSKLGAGGIELELHDGRTLRTWTDQAPGGTQRPLSWEQLTDKFVDCTALAATPLPLDGALSFVAFIRSLEREANAGRWAKALSPV